jgi:hypothetical protein
LVVNVIKNGRRVQKGEERGLRERGGGSLTLAFLKFLKLPHYGRGALF